MGVPHGLPGHNVLAKPVDEQNEASDVTSRRTSASIRMVRRRRARHLLTPLRRPRRRTP